MKRLLLSVLCFVVAFGLYGEDNGRELCKDTKHYLVKKDKKWYEFKSDISIYEGSRVLEQTCRQLLGIDEQQTLQGHVEERLNTYDSRMPYSKEKHNLLALEDFVGKDSIFIGPKGNPIGNYQTFEISKYYLKKRLNQDNSKEWIYSKEWNIIYDLKNDKVLTIDDIFVPERATLLKNNTGRNFFSMYVQENNISCGITPANGTTKYEILNYVENEDILTEQFKKNLDIDELRAEHDRKAAERQQQELEKQRQKQDSLQKKREEQLAKTAYKRIANGFGKLTVNQTFSLTSNTTELSKTNVIAGDYVLNTIKNEDRTIDSLWTKGMITPQYVGGQRPGVSKRMSYSQTKTETTTRVMGPRRNPGVFSYESGHWTTYFDIDIPADNPLFKQRLCKLLMNKSCKQLEDAGKRFVKSFEGKWIGNKKANVVTIRGRVLSYNPGKYYSYAYRHIYSNNNYLINKTLSNNIIYDITNQKVLSLSDVLTIEEIANLGLKKKAKADLALDNYNLYVGIDGKPVCTYALCRDNWNKFTTGLQDLVGPYENLPTKIDSTAFVFKDYEGIQPASISYKVSQEPSYRGHADSLLVYLKSNLALPDTMKSEHSWELQFAVGRDGRLSDIKISSNKKDDGGEAIASQLTEAFEQMPAWQPLELAGLGTQKSLQTFDVKFVPYTISNYSAGDNMKMDEKTDVRKSIKENVYIYGMFDEKAQFPGGDEAYIKWLGENIKYPSICKTQGIQGRVIVRFVVNTDGSISEIEVVKSPHPALSKEAERIVKLMPKWIPAMQDGKPVRSPFIMPLMFKIP